MKTALQPLVLAGLLIGCGEVAHDTPDAPPTTADAAAPDAGADDAAIDATVLVCGPDKASCVGVECGATMCLQPAHVASGFGIFAAPSLAATVISASATFDTATGAISGVRAASATPSSYEVVSGIGFVRRGQGTAAPLALWVFGDLTIAAPTRAIGVASVMLASTSSLTISTAGAINVGAGGIVPGPGGFAGGTYRTAGTGCGGGGAPTGTGTNGDEGTTDGGGGGGGFGTSGATGGANVGVPGTGGAGGASGGCTTALDAALVGGSGGGGGDNSGTVPGPFGGGGGGALQLTALGQLRVSGIINLGGGGGRTPDGNDRDGAGGGSGGALYLEAPVITIAASAGIFANGGGGGSKSTNLGPCAGMPAEDGKASLVPAAGSTCASGNGGAGAAGSAAATAGASDSGAGGGGGGLGRIVLRTLATQTPTVASTRLSPGQTSAAFQIVKTL
jgi:hypothetical protein